MIFDISGADVATAMRIQSDGRIVLAGYSGTDATDYSVIRLNSNGTLDTSFSGDGRATFDFDASWDKAYALSIQSDGKVVLAGVSYLTSFSILRLRSDGTLDTSFGGDGKATFEVGSHGAQAVNVQPDGKIVMSGGSDFSVDVFRLNSDGTLDSSFSGDGRISNDGADGNLAQVMGLQSDGAVVVAGYVGTHRDADQDYAVSFINADGTYRNGFRIDISGLDSAQALSILPDNKILLAGISGTYGAFDYSIVRLNADGTLDTSFSGDGRAVFDIRGSDSVQALGVQSDGKILLAGSSGTYDAFDYSIIRLNTDGTLDTSFSGDGKATFDIHGSDTVTSLGLQADGKIVLAGSSGGQYTDYSILRLNADGTLDTSFGPANHVPTGSVTLAGTALVGRILTARNTLADVDGMGAVRYQWLADGVVIGDATSAAFKLTLAQAGCAISVLFSYTDGSGKEEWGRSDSVSVPLLFVGTPKADALLGSTRNDTLQGLAGDDTLDGGTGSDSMTGGDGSDTYYVDNTGDKVIETNATASTGGTDIVLSSLAAYTLGSNVENGRIIIGTVANLSGNSLGNVLYAGANNNILNGGSGSDTAHYGYARAAVTLNLGISTAQTTGGSGNDTLTAIENLSGSKYADKLTGNTGANKLDGSAGDDTLIGGAGKDSLTGGEGNDVFDFNALTELGLGSSTRDVITDFLAGQDKIDLSTIDANSTRAGDQAFKFVSSFSTTVGQVRYAGGIIYLNTDSDTAAEYEIQLTGTIPASLTAANFVL